MYINIRAGSIIVFVKKKKKGISTKHLILFYDNDIRFNMVYYKCTHMEDDLSTTNINGEKTTVYSWNKYIVPYFKIEIDQNLYSLTEIRNNNAKKNPINYGKACDTFIYPHSLYFNWLLIYYYYYYCRPICFIQNLFWYTWHHNCVLNTCSLLNK